MCPDHKWILEITTNADCMSNFVFINPVSVFPPTVKSDLSVSIKRDFETMMTSQQLLTINTSTSCQEMLSLGLITQHLDVKRKQLHFYSY